MLGTLVVVGLEVAGVGLVVVDVVIVAEVEVLVVVVAALVVGFDVEDNEDDVVVLLAMTCGT